MRAVVILAGGKSRRMGRDKLALPMDGETLLESVVHKFSYVFENVYLSVADAEKYPEIKADRLVDIIPGAGPMSGLHAALSALHVDGVFLVAADLPFASPEAALKIIELGKESGKSACVVRLPDGKLEPLFAYYRKDILDKCKALISIGDYRMTELFTEESAQFVAPEALGEFWSDALIMNVNYPEDYAKLKQSFA
ncbi:MAG: molybdenum cofactor guanylyltransferase [Oscillospiraceae bacterium]|nr:molybdenum cofactor guanylyltransferase [Oscillospiraceae bacterium]